MNFLDTAYQILKQTGQPLHYTKIAQLMSYSWQTAHKSSDDRPNKKLGFSIINDISLPSNQGYIKMRRLQPKTEFLSTGGN